MDVTPLIPAGKQIIQSYGRDGFRINGAVHAGAVIVTPDCVSPWDVRGAMDDLSAEDFAAAQDADVVLLGCGARQRFLSSGLRSDLRKKGVNPEPMDSGAACRTYNVLLAEGRRVVAFLLPVEG